MREWVYGRNAVYEVLRSNRRQVFRLRLALGVQSKGRLAEILDICLRKKVPVEHATRVQLDSLSPGNQGVALETSEYPYSTLQDILVSATRRKEPPFLLILDILQDPQNLGTLLRTAEAVGVHGVVLPLRRAVTVTPSVINASAGACEYLLITQVNLAQAISTLKENDVWVVGLENHSDAKLPDELRLDGALALVVGSEGEGMRSLVRESCDLLMRLPMRGKVESLNAAVAGSIALYLAWGKRGFNIDVFSKL